MEALNKVRSFLPRSIKLAVLLILCFQNSVYTVLRRYSQGVLEEKSSKHEILLLSEIIKLIFSACVISTHAFPSISPNNPIRTLPQYLWYLTTKSRKMLLLAFIYGSMNILSFIALQYISAGEFVIIAQCKILSTATCSALMLRRRYSWAQWRALIQLMLGVLLFTAPVTKIALTKAADGGESANQLKSMDSSTALATTSSFLHLVGIAAVSVEVTLSGFSSIYFEKVIKTDPEQLGIWERNFQLALGSVPIYLGFIYWNRGGQIGYFGGWSMIALALSCLGAAGGLLVALSIKYGDSILKTLAVTGSIIISSVLDHYLLGGPLTMVMVLAGGQVILAICNYTFDSTPVDGGQNKIVQSTTADQKKKNGTVEAVPLMLKSSLDEDEKV